MGAKVTRQSSKRAALMVLALAMVNMCLLAVVVVEGSTLMNVMVPAYFYPTANPSAWSALNSAAASLPNRVVAIANVNSGPGNSAQTSDFTPVIRALQAESGRVIGYVDTNYGSNSLTTVKANIDTWYSFYPSVNGIFFDQAASTDGEQAYYQNLYKYVKSKSSTSLVVANLGTSFLKSYLIYNGSRVASIICIFETNESATTWTQGHLIMIAITFMGSF